MSIAGFVIAPYLILVSVEDDTPERLNKIQKQLNEKYEHKQSVFEPEEDPVVKKYVEDLWQRIVASKKLDIVSVEKLSGMITR